MADESDIFYDSDSEDSSTDLDVEFNAAAKRMNGLAAELKSSDLLKAYAFYKQASEGPCNVDQPGWYEMKAKQKWEAWNRLGEMSSETAKRNYVDLISELDPSWKSDRNKADAQQWVRVSTLQNEEDAKSEDAEGKTVFDMCKAGSVSEVMASLKERPELLNRPDEEGLALIHWAADRGHAHVISRLLEEPGFLVDLRDGCGQTALHYAASCDHLDCVQVLLSNGADKTLLDDDGYLPADLASEQQIKQLLL